MPIDPSIAMGFRNPQIQVQNPVAQYAQAQELNLNALKMQEAQQSMASRNMLRSLDPSSPDYINQVSRVDPKLGLELSKGRTQARTAEIEQKTKIGTLLKNYANQVVANPNLETAMSVVQRFGRDTGEDVSTEMAKLQTIGNNPDALRKWGMGYAMDADKILAQTTLTPYQKQSLGVQMRGQDISASTAMRGQDIGRIPVGYRMTPEGTIEAIPGGPTTTNLSPKEVQVREAKFPQATSALKSFESSSDNLIKDMIRLRDHPGLSSITGVLYGRTPSLTKEGREAQALYDKILARGGFQELQNMRNASSTGGALGNVSNQEGTQLRQAFGALDRTQEAGSVKNELDRLVENVTGAKGRVREAYDMTYDYKGGGGATPPPPPPPAPGAGGNTVTIPNGKVLTFPTPEAAAAYKQAAGL
jgi:hypothetical protein